MPVIFKSRVVKVVYTDHGSENLCITFTSKTTRYIPGRSGFAKEVLDDMKVSNLCFISQGQHWWHVPEMEQCLRAARSVTSRYSTNQIFAYGSSMGGYGALYFSSALNAGKVLAISPQNLRWNANTGAIDEKWSTVPKDFPELAVKPPNSDYLDGANKKAGYLIFYDSLRTYDRREIVYMEGLEDLHTVALPFSAHPSGHYLVEAGLLKKILSDMLSGQPLSKIARASRAARRKHRYHSPLYAGGAALKLIRRGHLQVAEQLLTDTFPQIIKSIPRKTGVLWYLSPRFRKPLFWRKSHYILNLTQAAERVGRYNMADTYLSLAERHFAPSARHFHLKSIALRRCGDLDAARKYAEKACLGDPEKPYYSAHLNAIETQRETESRERNQTALL